MNIQNHPEEDTKTSIPILPSFTLLTSACLRSTLKVTYREVQGETKMHDFASRHVSSVGKLLLGQAFTVSVISIDRTDILIHAPTVTVLLMIADP